MIKNIKNKLQSSILYPFLISATLLLLTIIAISVAALSYNSEQRGRASLEEKINQVGTIVSKSLATPLWNFDYELAKTYLQALESDPDFVSAEIYDAEGELIVSHPDGEEENPDINRTYEISSPDKSQVIGRIKVGYSSERIQYHLGFIG